MIAASRQYGVSVGSRSNRATRGAASAKAAATRPRSHSWSLSAGQLHRAGLGVVARGEPRNRLDRPGQMTL